MLFAMPVCGQWNMYTHDGYQSIQSVTTIPSGNSILMVAYPNGIVRSTNGGTVWGAVNTGLPATLSQVLSVFYNNSVLLAGTASGIYRSTNGGDSWALANTGMPTASASNYVKKFFRSGNTTLAILSANLSSGGGIYRSTDDGTNWFSANNGLSTNMTIYQVAEIGGVLYAATSSGVSKSTNLGVSWSPIATANFTTYAIQGTAARMVAITAGGYKYSTNGGGTWTACTGAPAAPSAGELILYDSKYWAITSPTGGQVLRSTDNGSTFSAYTTGLVGADAIAQYCFHASGTTLYLGTIQHLYSTAGTTTGVEDAVHEQLPAPFPTLFTDGFQVDLSGQQPGAAIMLMDASGRMVRRVGNLPAGMVRLDREGLASGTYRVWLTDKEGAVRSCLGAVVAQ
jgi:photosystem II stability/assembly factor-like uncharacterized protein